MVLKIYANNFSETLHTCRSLRWKGVTPQFFKWIWLSKTGSFLTYFETKSCYAYSWRSLLKSFVAYCLTTVWREVTGRNFWEKLLLSETGLFLTLFGPKSYPLFMEYTLRTFLKLCGQLIQVVRKPDNKKYIFKKTISPKKGNFTPNWAKKLVILHSQNQITGQMAFLKMSRWETVGKQKWKYSMF